MHRNRFSELDPYVSDVTLSVARIFLNAALQKRDPSFEIARQRVEARNWSLFSARQVIRDQGGDVSAFSEPGKNNGFLIVLPLGAEG